MPNWPTEPAPLTPWYNLDYFIYFRNQADAEAAIAAYCGGDPARPYINKSPNFIKALFGIADDTFGGTVDDAPVWLRSMHPGTPWFTTPNYTGTQIFFPGPSVPPTTYRTSEDWWMADGDDYQTDTPGPDIFPVNPHAFVWTGIIYLAYGANSGEPQPEPILKRRWATGFEFPANGSTSYFVMPDGVTFFPSAKFSRDASRTVDGIGLAYRSENFAILCRCNLNRFGAPADTTASRERLYIRPRNFGVAGAANGRRIWETNSGSGGLRLRISTAGNLEFYRVTTGGTATLIGSIALTLNSFVRVDILIKFFAQGLGTDVDGSLYVAGNLVAQGSGNIQAVGTVNHTDSYVGNNVSDAANDLEVDIDDWVNSEWPGTYPVANLTRADWIFGSHIQRIVPTAYGSGNAWPGNFRILLQLLAVNSLNGVASAIALTRMETDSELDGDIDRLYDVISQLGAASMTIGLVGTNSGATDGTLGYKIGAAADVLTSVDQLSTLEGQATLYSPTGMIVPDPVEPLKLVHVKSNDANTDTTRIICANAEFLGSFGPEDDLEGSPGSIALTLGIHNSPYPILSGATPSPPNFYGVEGGTYVGNGTGQDILLNMPTAHWIFGRNVTAGANGWRWWSSNFSANQGISSNAIGGGMPQVFVDLDGVCKFRVCGNNSEYNQSGITYQYIAISDESMRFMINGAFKHATGVSTANELYPKSTFLAEAQFFFAESYQGSVTGYYFKGTGHAANDGSRVDAASSANVATFVAGGFTSRSTLNSLNIHQIAYSAWRQLDFNNQRGCFIGQYTGNGAGNRTITVDLGGRRPMLGWVTPLNGTSVYRDPSHSGNASSLATLSSTNTTSIRGGGIDQLLVGTSLNANGIVYSVFIIPGSITAGNDGWSTNGIFELAQPGWPDGISDGPDNPDIFDGNPNVIGQGGLILSGAAPFTLLESVSGLYTITDNKRNDTLQDRQASQTEIDVPIPDIRGKTGFVGG